MFLLALKSMKSFVGSTFYFCCQGEVGVGLPGPRGERGDPGSRVRHQQYYCIIQSGMSFELHQTDRQKKPNLLGFVVFFLFVTT